MSLSFKLVTELKYLRSGKFVRYLSSLFQWKHEISHTKFPVTYDEQVSHNWPIVTYFNLVATSWLQALTNLFFSNTYILCSKKNQIIYHLKFRCLGIWGFRDLGIWGFRDSGLRGIGIWGFKDLGIQGLGFRIQDQLVKSL